MERLRSTEELSASYAQWRSSRLGRITDRLEQQLILELLGAVAGKTLLDVGCGDGELAPKLNRLGAIVTGVDMDPIMIAAAHRRSDMENTQLRLVEGRAEQLPFNDESFDCVLAVTVLCFVRDGERAVAEMARVLKAGGHLVIGELGRWSLWAVYRRVRGWLGNSTWQATTFRTSRELRPLTQAAGLQVVEVRGAIRPAGRQRNFSRPLICGSVEIRRSDQRSLLSRQKSQSRSDGDRPCKAERIAAASATALQASTHPNFRASNFGALQQSRNSDPDESLGEFCSPQQQRHAGHPTLLAALSFLSYVFRCWHRAGRGWKHGPCSTPRADPPGHGPP